MMVSSSRQSLYREPLRLRVGVTTPQHGIRPASTGVTPSFSLVLAHAPDLSPLTALVLASNHESLQVAAPPAGSRSFPALFPRIFPWMLAPIPRWSSWCSYPFLPRRHRPSSSGDRLGNSTTSPYSDFRTGRVLGAAVISLCSGLQVCSPLRSLLPPCASAHWAAVAFTSPHISVCHLPEQGIC
jgi:hypothetical protein